MFTGIVEGKGRIREVRRIQGDCTIGIEPLFDMSECRVGDSISVDGVCLTVKRIINKKYFIVDVSSETLSRTTLGLLKPGNEVNLERALLPTSRLGGHIVSGHVDGTGQIMIKQKRGESWFFRIQVHRSLSRYMVEKGSVAMDGISLTINYCEDHFFDVNINP